MITTDYVKRILGMRPRVFCSDCIYYFHDKPSYDSNALYIVVHPEHQCTRAQKTYIEQDFATGEVTTYIIRASCRQERQFGKCGKHARFFKER